MAMTGMVFMFAAVLTCLGAGWTLKKRRVPSVRAVLAAFALGSLVLLYSGAGMAFAQGVQEAGTAAGWAFLGASLAAGLACIGAGIAVAVVGAAALGVVGEKPELLGSTLIYLGLAEGIAIYGLITALLILGKV
ncbi:MAG: ATP synthase subunit C [Thermovirgaceae bacterium]